MALEEIIHDKNNCISFYEMRQILEWAAEKYMPIRSGRKLNGWKDQDRQNKELITTNQLIEKYFESIK